MFGDGDDDLVDRWIEETLRHDTSTQLLARHLVDDLTLHGVTAPKGSKLLFCLGAANRDDRVFTDPDTFDVHRDEDELRQILSFGGGRHFCLGANLARLEARVALRVAGPRARVGRGRPRQRGAVLLRQRARLRAACRCEVEAR